MSDWGEFSWGPDKRPTPARGSVVTVSLAVVIVALLAAGVVGAVVQRSSSSPNPAGYQRVVDTADHLSLAFPGTWQVPSASAGTLSSEIQDLKAKNPGVAAQADLALDVLQKVSVGVFAIDIKSQTSLFAYGADDPQVPTIDQLASGKLVTQMSSLGAKNVQASRVHVPIGSAEQVSAQLTLGTTTVSEVVDYVVLRGRLVAIVIIGPGKQPPTSVLHTIEATLKAG